MHPWIADQANREHIAELRALGRPFRRPRAGLGTRRFWGGRPEPTTACPPVGSPKHRISVRF
jgi:hypothetical protein